MDVKTRLVRQTLGLSGSHFVVRVLGFLLRILLSRELGAAAMGLVELAHSAQQLLITPVVSGLPAAVSRMSARAEGNPARQTRVLRVALALALCVSLPLTAVAFLLRGRIAAWLGDARTLVALLCCLPCIPVLAVSCVLNGYFYGTGRPALPAAGELLEQGLRFFLCLRLCAWLTGMPLALRAAIPAAGTLAGEVAGLLLMLPFCVVPLLFTHGSGSRRAALSELLSLSLPLTGMRLVSSLTRTVNATLIPARLVASGLPGSEALSQLGMMNGMLMPVLLLPSFITCSLSMVCAPEMARRQAQGQPLRRLCLRTLGVALAVGLCAMGGVFLFAPLVSRMIYRQAELLPLLRRCCALIPVFALSQVVGGLLNGLGMQREVLRITLLCGVIGVVLNYLLVAQPALRLWGAVIALSITQVLALVLSARTLHQATISPKPALPRQSAQT